MRKEERSTHAARTGTTAKKKCGNAKNRRNDYNNMYDQARVKITRRGEFGFLGTKRSLKYADTDDLNAVAVRTNKFDGQRLTPENVGKRTN